MKDVWSLSLKFKSKIASVQSIHKHDAIVEETYYSESKIYNSKVGLSLHNSPALVFTPLLIISHENSYPRRVNTFGGSVSTGTTKILTQFLIMPSHVSGYRWLIDKLCLTNFTTVEYCSLWYKWLWLFYCLKRMIWIINYLDTSWKRRWISPGTKQ